MKKVLFMLLVMFALSACQSKDSYVKEFSDFVDKVEMEAADTEPFAVWLEKHAWQKRKRPLVSGQNFISEFRDDDNKCASFIYSDSPGKKEFRKFLKKLPEVAKCRC